MKLNFKASTMLMVNVWPFVILAVLLADAAPSSEVSGEYYLMQKLLNNGCITKRKI